MIKLERKQLIIIFSLVLIFCLFIFFRFYNLDKRIIFNWDQERDAWVIKQILSEKKLTLIGPRVLGPKGFFLGPFFTYLLAPFYLLTNLHPRAIIFFLAVYNVTFFTVSFLILRKIFNQLIALVFLLFWALHPGLIAIDQISWNPLLVPLIVVLSWWLFSKSLKKTFIKGWFWIGIIFGLGINFHFQLTLLFPFVLVFLFSERKNLFKKTAFFLLGIALCFGPLLLFDLRHQGLNTKLLLAFIDGSGNQISYLSWLPVWRNIVRGFFGFNFFLLPAIFYLSIFGLLVWSWKRAKEIWLKRFSLSFLLLWIIFPFSFSLFGQRPSEYYFNFLYPFLVLFFARLFLNIFKKWQLVFLIIIFLFLLRANQIKSGLKTNFLGLHYKDKVVQRIVEIGKEKRFNVSFSVPLGMDVGYRYFFDFYQIKQTNDFSDPLFQIVIPPNSESELIGGIGLQVPGSFQPPGNDVK